MCLIKYIACNIESKYVYKIVLCIAIKYTCEVEKGRIVFFDAIFLVHIGRGLQQLGAFIVKGKV